MLFDKEEINTFCFTNDRGLFPNDLHGNYIICTAGCKFHLTIDDTKFKNFLLIICRDIHHFCKIITRATCGS